jgi:GAF domain-containing protein
VTQAFPPKRLEVLRLLCAQAAVTIEKAQMYRSMEEAKQAAEAATLMKSTCTFTEGRINCSFGQYESRNPDSLQCSHRVQCFLTRHSTHTNPKRILRDDKYKRN